jgi:hypothetical protein
MRNRIYALALALLLPLAASAPAAAQSGTKTGDWSAVQALSPGTKIVVRTKDGDRLSGRFDSATDLVINFTHDGRKVSLTRDGVGRVQINRGKSHLKGALVGAGIGAGAGVGAGGIIISKGDFVARETFIATTFLGAGIGAGIGAALGMGNKNETIYEAP